MGPVSDLIKLYRAKSKKAKKKRVTGACVAASMATQHVHAYWTWVLQPNRRTRAFQLIIDIIRKYHNYR